MRSVACATAPSTDHVLGEWRCSANHGEMWPLAARKFEARSLEAVPDLDAGRHRGTIRDVMLTSPELTKAIDRLITGSRSDPPARYAATVCEAGLALGALSVDLYVQDYAQQLLLPVDGGPALSIDGSGAGDAFRRSATVAFAGADDVVLWVPLMDGSERLGVLSMVFPAVDAEVRRISERFAAVAAEMMVNRGARTDLFARVRRTREMNLAAEMQWELLPPLSFTTNDVHLAGLLEPAYTVGGDSFDYSYDELLRLALFDAMGHGVQAALTAALAVSSYRHARRRGLSLEATYLEVDAAVAEHRRKGFVTAVFAEFDPSSGVLRWIDAGHPAPKVLRRGSFLLETPQAPCTPCGFGPASGVSPDEQPSVGEVVLERGDLVLFITDGTIEQTDAAGVPFGERRLVDLIAGHAAAGLPVEESLRVVVSELMAYAQRSLRDDATLLLMEYRRT